MGLVSDPDCLSRDVCGHDLGSMASGRKTVQAGQHGLCRLTAPRAAHGVVEPMELLWNGSNGERGERWMAIVGLAIILALTLPGCQMPLRN